MSLQVFQFSAEVRKPTIKVVAEDELDACARFAEIVGLPEGTVVRPKFVTPFDPAKHRDAEIAKSIPPELAARMAVAWEMMPVNGRGGKYGDVDDSRFPCLTYFGKGGIEPEWVIDRSTGKARISGEFESIPRYFLKLTPRPSVEDIRRAGGKLNIGGGFDTMVEHFRERFPWIQVEDGEALRQMFLDELDRYERGLL